MKVVLVFRDKRKGGKSIEGVFRQLLQANFDGIAVESWEYNWDKNLFANIRSLLATKADVFHFTGDINHLAPFMPGKKIIVTVHDVGRYKELSGIKKWIFGNWYIKWPLLRAQFVTVVSNFTRKDILKLLPSVNHKMKVIYNGLSKEWRPTNKLFNGQAPRILQVGTTPNKNLETLIRAAKDSNYVLVIAGPLSSNQQELLKSIKVTFEHYTDLNEQQLIAQYDAADILVFVSTHEGFGLPVIEAQAKGIPVITSRMTSLPEVAGEGALFVNDPYDHKELRGSIEKIIQDESYRSGLVKSGFGNVKRFQQAKMIEEYTSLYKDLIPE